MYNNVWFRWICVAPQHPHFLAAGWSFQVCCRKGPSWAPWQRRYLCPTWPISGSSYGLSLRTADETLPYINQVCWFGSQIEIVVNHTQLFWNYLGRLSSLAGRYQNPFQSEAVGACICILWRPWKQCIAGHRTAGEGGPDSSRDLGRDR